MTYKKHEYISDWSDILQILPLWKECKCLHYPGKVMYISKKEISSKHENVWLALKDC